MCYMQQTDLGVFEKEHGVHKEAWLRTPQHVFGNDGNQADSVARALAISSEAQENPEFGKLVDGKTKTPTSNLSGDKALSRARNSSFWGLAVGDVPQCALACNRGTGFGVRHEPHLHVAVRPLLCHSNTAA
jgi:hypothetical protein